MKTTRNRYLLVLLLGLAACSSQRSSETSSEGDSHVNNSITRYVDGLQNDVAGAHAAVNKMNQAVAAGDAMSKELASEVK